MQNNSDNDFTNGVEDGFEFTFGTAPEEPVEERPRVKFEVVEPQKEAEFAIPDKYGEKIKEQQSNPETAKSIWTTYVPRFTEVSENYRMASPNGMTRRDDHKVIEQSSLVEESEDTLDPTAELDEQPVEEYAESVTVKQIEEPKETQARMFKFFSEEDEDVQQDDTEPAVEETEETVEQAQEEDSLEETFETENDGEPISEETPITKEHAKSYEEPSGDIGDKIAKPNSNEYCTFSQRESFVNKLLDTIMSIKIRFFTTLALAAVLMVVECLFWFGIDFPSLLGIQGQNSAMAVLDLFFVICLYLIAIPETVAAVRYLTQKHLTPELYLTLGLIVTAGYTVVCCTEASGAYPLFGLLFALLCMSAISASYFKKSAECSAFMLVSQKGEKCVIDNKNTRTLDRENAALDGIIKEHKSKTARFFRTTFVSGFFSRADKCSENRYNFLLTLCISLGLGSVTGAVAFFILGGLLSAATAFVLVFMLSVPAASMLSHKLPFCAATEELQKERTVMIGESSVLDYSGIDVITFDDYEIFGEEDIKLQRIMLYGKNENLSKALSQMSALFMKVGGPLDKLFSAALDRKCQAAYNTYVEEDGVSGEIDFVPVYAGTMEYMLRHNIAIPEDESKQSAPLSNTTRVIYAAEGDEVYAKFYIRYSFSEEFTMLLPIFEEEGITPLIYTRDPNVTADFIKTLTAGNDRIRIMKKRTSPSDDGTVYRTVNAGAVVLGSKSNAINSLLIAKRYAKTANNISKAELICSTAGALIAAVLSLASLSLLPTVVYAAWQGALATGLFIYTKKTIYIPLSLSDSGE